MSTAPGVCVCVCVCPLLQVCVCVCVCVCPLLQVCVCVCECVPTAPSVCALGWVKCREQNFTAGYTLYNYVCDKKKKIQNRFFFFFFYKTDYGKMLKYRSISSDDHAHLVCKAGSVI